MKATLKTKIVSYSKQDGMATLSIESIGPMSKVDTAPQNAKDCSLAGVLKLKLLVSDQLKLGTTLTITVSDEEKDEGSF